MNALVIRGYRLSAFRCLIRVGALLLTLAGTAQAIEPQFVFTTLAGSAGQAGHADGTGSIARFGDPFHLAVDGEKNVYVADGSNHVIRKITPLGDVTTIAGLAGQSGSMDGMGSTARFNTPRGVAVGGDGTVYVADTGNSIIRKIASSGEVTTLAGTALPISGGGHADGTGAAAGFQFPYALAVDPSGNVYVADSGNHTIRKISPGGVVITLAGTALQSGSADGAGSAARFDNPAGISIDGAGQLHVVDANTGRIRRVTADGHVSTIYPGILPFYSALVEADGTVFGAGNTMSTIWMLPISGGKYYVGGDLEVGSSDGPGNLVRFNNPIGIAMDGAGDLYVTDHDNYTVRKGVRIKINWSTPAPIAFGTPLSSAHLNATANVPGTFTYSAEIGTLFGIGTSYVSATFTPAGGSTLNQVRMELPIVVQAVVKQTPVITWPQPAAINYFTRLGPTQLNATANVAGNLIYREPHGTLLDVGTHTLRVTFYPSDANTYSEATAEVTLVVNAVSVVPLQVLAQPASQIVASASTATFTFSVSASPPPAFTWEESGDGGKSWTYLNDGGQYSGTHSATLTVAGVSAAMNGYLYRCVALSGNSGASSNPAMLNISGSIAYLGGYFGTFAQGGTWAMFVGSPSRFIAYLPWRKSAIVETLTVGADGNFSVACTERIAGGVKGTLTLTGSISAPSQSQRHVSARLVEIGESLSGSFPTSGALTSLSGDFFSARALGVSQGELYLIVGYSGDTQAVVVTSKVVDGAHGILKDTGAQTFSTDEGRDLSVSIDLNARAVSATLTPAITTASALSGESSRTSLALPAGSIQFAGLSQAVPSTSRFANIATRAYCSTGSAVTIGGFVISGSGQKQVLIRAVGPSLTAQGILEGDALLDPMIAVHDARKNNLVIATNDNWNEATNVAEITQVSTQVGASALLGSDVKSSALLLTLSPGVYSFVVSGKNSTSGIVLLEVYDADTISTGARFGNIATRAYAATGDKVTIGGFVVSGNAPKRLLIRAVGPTLTKSGLGVTEVLADPKIVVHDARNGNAVIATNDNWTDDGNESTLLTNGARVGATPLDSADLKSAGLLMTLQPGVYSFVSSDTNPGVVLIEIYDSD